MRLPTRGSDSTSENIVYVSPEKEVNAGLWTLFAGATVLLSLRIWVKFTRRHGVWWDDYILLASWCVLAANNSLISYEYATGYVIQNGVKWDDRMHILINITSCGTLIGQAWTKSAFAVTLLKLTERWQQYILWYCIISMNCYMVTKCILQWAKVCNDDSYQVWYRLDFCLEKKFRNDFKEGGNIYNITMDYVMAAFPWFLTWKLPMRRAEKIGLCMAMSLGVVVATVAAVRTAWKDEGNHRDPLYYWRNGLSNVWYSSEVAGTIIVQCVPVLRPFLRDVHQSLTSKRIPSTAGQADPARKSFTWAVSNQAKDSKHMSGSSDYSGATMNGFNFGFHETKITSGGHIELRTIEEERDLEKRDEEKLYRMKNNFQGGWHTSRV
ncbi:hypothetical protein P280DRAFT_169433 [Massarina eburnea CBS 473.64]|uniref:Rhodopsin domain-containing protein n=1 Tax=Massarina eburnea CBS 473.64 TaxID=1395130 RepID=A0A6A6RNS0_9PLEO|nr:hypothetical protein P280DRAFT_169433 [Massarina eburnea CBS 473.64]